MSSIKNKVKKAFITGVNGQDGSYLTELLLEKGYEVHGMIRRSSSFNTKRIDHIIDKNPNFKFHYGDVTDPLVISNLISKIQPDEVYGLAAQSHVKVSFEHQRLNFTEEWDTTCQKMVIQKILSSTQEVHMGLLNFMLYG